MFPLIMIVVGAFTILGEEVGWRGFLEGALRPLRPAHRYLLIGFLWEIWHFTTRTRDKTIVAILISLALMGLIATLLSWLIGKAMDRCRSVLVATMIHGILDACYEFPYWQARVAIAVAVTAGCWLLWTCPKQSPVR